MAVHRVWLKVKLQLVHTCPEDWVVEDVDRQGDLAQPLAHLPSGGGVGCRSDGDGCGGCGGCGCGCGCSCGGFCCDGCGDFCINYVAVKGCGGGIGSGCGGDSECMIHMKHTTCKSCPPLRSLPR